MTDAALPRLLVVTTVHAADDTRIREKLIRSLSEVAAITYATRPPQPTDLAGIASWIPLHGGRFRRNLTALRLLFAKRYRAAVVHDPELLPAAILSAVVRRTRVVVDVHEHVPGQLRTKEWLHPTLRRPAAWVAARLLRLAERTCHITLAEPGYQQLFTRRHHVFANYPADLPEPAPGDGSIVYVGDGTEARGLDDLAAAAARMDPPPTVRIVGRCDDDLAARLAAVPGIELLGRLPHGEAMEIVRRSGVGVSPLRDIPNYRYSLPTKVVEYLGSGIPVVATDLPGTRSVIGHLPGVTLIPPGDVPAMAAALSLALHDPAARSASASNATEIRRTLRWPRDDVVAFYLDVLGTGEHR